MTWISAIFIAGMVQSMLMAPAGINARNWRFWLVMLPMDVLMMYAAFDWYR